MEKIKAVSAMKPKPQPLRLMDIMALSGPPLDIQAEGTVEPLTISPEGTQCGKRLFGFMPPCVLSPGHDGPHQDGFGGFYGDNRPEHLQKKAGKP